MTINEIAKMAGVSRATVSRYLNHGYVSAANREKIGQIIEETGYVPSAPAQTLRSKRTNYIGVVIPKINSDSIAQMVSGIHRSLAGTGYYMLLACTDNHEEEEVKSLRVFKEDKVDGLILMGTVFTAEHRRELEDCSVPLVILAQNIPGYPCVYSDDYLAGYELGAHVRDTGTVFGMIRVNEQDQAVGVNRRQGVLDALAEAGIRIPEEYEITSDFDLQSGYEKARALLEAHGDIDTLICATDTIACGALRYLHEIHAEIPAQIQIAGFGDSNFAKAAIPELTTVHYYYEEQGYEAGCMLQDLMKHKGQALSKSVKLGIDVRVHQSTRRQEKEETEILS